MSILLCSGRIFLCYMPMALGWMPVRLCYLPTRLLCSARYCERVRPYALAVRCTVLSGRRYAKCGTELAYGAMQCTVLSSRMLLRSCYAMSGTELAYGAGPDAVAWTPMKGVDR
eukprot:1583343-Rhodomonas_salina.1